VGVCQDASWRYAQCDSRRDQARGHPRSQRSGAGQQGAKKKEHAGGGQGMPLAPCRLPLVACRLSLVTCHYFQRSHHVLRTPRTMKMEGGYLTFCA